MPLYEYDCGGGCGSFSASRPMVQSSLPAPCPTCGDQAPRILSVTAVRHGRGRRRRGVPEPRLVEKKERDAPLARPPAHAHTAGRPWMLGH